MRLRDYLRQHEMSQADFGRRVGVTQGAVQQWLSGSSRPSPETAARVETATGGAVTRLEVLYPDENPGPPAAPTEQGAAA